MNRQNFYRKEYKKRHPHWNDSLTLYHNFIDEKVNASTVVLDVGCGHGELLKDVYAKTNHTYGIDPDAEALAKNTLIKNKHVAFVESMPFEDNFFDVVVAEWVLEHLDDPQKSFQEIYRVLKPGGHVIFLTPNVWNYNVWIIRLIPNRFHNFFTRKLYGRQEGDTYPTRYKINSVRKMNKLLGSIGYTPSKVVLNGDPSYISFNRPLFWLACFLEWILDLRPFRFAKVHIIGVYRKSS